MVIGHVRALPAVPGQQPSQGPSGSTTPHVRPLPALPSRSQVSLVDTAGSVTPTPPPLPPREPSNTNMATELGELGRVPELKVHAATTQPSPTPSLSHKPSQTLTHKSSQSLAHKTSQSLAHKTSQSLAHKTSQSLAHKPSQTLVHKTSQSFSVSQPASPNLCPTSPSISPVSNNPSPSASAPSSSLGHTPNPTSPTEKSHGIVARLGKKKRQLSRDLLKFNQPEDGFEARLDATPTPIDANGEPFQMIAQHHMQTMGLHKAPPSSYYSPSKPKYHTPQKSPSSSSLGSPGLKPQTPSKPPRLNLGLFSSSRARKDSAGGGGVSTSGNGGNGNGRRPSTPGSAGMSGLLFGQRSGSGSTTHGSTENVAADTMLDVERASEAGSVRKRGSSTPSGAGAIAGLFGRSPSPGTAASSAVMAKSVSSPGITINPASPTSPVAARSHTAALSGKPSPPPKPAKLKAQAQGILNTALGLGGMSLAGRGSVGVMPNSPSIAAAIEYMRHEHERDPRGSLSRRAALDGPASLDEKAGVIVGEKAADVVDGERRAGTEVDRTEDERRADVTDSGVEEVEPQVGERKMSMSSDAGESDMGKASFSDVGADTSSGPSSSVGSLLSSTTGTGTSASEVSGPLGDSVVSGHRRDPNDADVSFGSDSDHEPDTSAFNPAFSFGAHARPQPKAPQDPDKRVSTASSQRTLTAWNTKRESGTFVFPNNAPGTAPLTRLHTSDGLAPNTLTDGGQDPGPNNPNPATDAFNSPIPRTARLGQLAGSLKRRSASMSILLPLPTNFNPAQPMSSESEASSPRLLPPPLPPRRPLPTDGAMTDSEGYMSSASNMGVGRKWGRTQGGIKGKIAAWTAAAEANGRKKHYHPRVGAGASTDVEPRRSDSPHQQGYPYSHSPASAPTLQVHTHVHLPSHAQTPLMSIAALAPAARDLALGVGKRVEKFYRDRSASGAGREPHPSLGATRVGSPGMGMGVGAEPMLSIPLRPAILGASGLLFGRPLDDPGVPRDTEGWVDEALGVRRCVGLPAFVSRSVRHLERWGGDEEGLFRISGRPSHVARLRAEFDAGADYELSEVPPSDLDPHAVSSLFKAYLRELPEPILTRTLKHQFDLAMTATDSTSNASFDISKLPTSVTSFGESSENMRSLDDSLLTDIKTLIDQLPQTNYILLHELCHLLRYTTEHAHTTKMPLGNLLLLFCPTLGFSAGFLRCLVEGQDVLFEWGRQAPVVEPTSPPPLPPRTIKTSTSTIVSPKLAPSAPVPPVPSKPAPSVSIAPTPVPPKHAASASSVRSLKSPLTIATDAAQPRARSQTTAGSAPPSRASMFFPTKRPSINLLFGNHDNQAQGSRHSSSSGESYLTSDDEPNVNPKRQTRPPRVSLDIPDGSFAPSLSPTKDLPEELVEARDPSPSKRSAQTPIADMFKSPLTAAVPTTAPTTVTVTGTSTSAGWESSKTLAPQLGLPFRNSEDAGEMGWSRGVLDAATASLGQR